MRPHRDIAPVDLAAALSQVANEFLTRFELCARWLVAIEIAYQTNAERNVVQIIAVHVAAIDLAAPAVAHFYLAIASRCSVANHEMISQPILHSSDVPVVIIEYACVTLPGSTVVHDDELPASPFHRRATDRFDYRSRQITVAGWTTPWPKKESARRRRWRRLETLIFFETRLLDYNLRAFLRRGGTRNFWRRAWCWRRQGYRATRRWCWTFRRHGSFC